MDTQNIITAMYNESGITKVGKTRQWAKGQVLSLVGFPNLPASFEMYFQNADGTPINAQGQIGTDGQVSIPDAFFANGSNINAWMWLSTSEDEGKYIYKFIFPIERCPRPADYTYSQEQATLVDQAIAALNDAVSETGQCVVEAQEAATLSESWAVGGTGAREGEDTDNAKYYAEQSAGSAESAGNSATAAEDSAEDSEAWAVGQRKGADVPSTDETYENNSKYYSQRSEAFANGTINGVTILPTDPAYEKNAKYWAGQAGDSATAAATSAATAQTYAQNYLAAFPRDTASGAIASFSDGADNVPIDDLMLNEDDTVTVQYRADTALYVAEDIEEVVGKSIVKISPSGITDANSITENSFVYVSANAVLNLPAAGAWYLWTAIFNSNNCMQLAYGARGNNPYIRAKVIGTWGDWEKIGKEAVDEQSVTSTIALFPSVGCCGDSFTAGYLYNKTDSPYYDPDYVPNGEYPAIGYPAVMGRLYGVDVTAYAKGGLTTTAYRTDAAGLPALLADEPKYLYIIALGLNDKTQNVPLGVEADIDTEPSTPTYLGNMGAIIRAIQSHAPYARIILCKSLWQNTSYYTYISDGVELLSSHLGIPYLETLNDPYFSSDAYVNGLKGLHPTAPLYAGMGKHIGELVGKCVIENPDYFYNFYVPNN